MVQKKLVATNNINPNSFAPSWFYYLSKRSDNTVDS